MDELHVTKELFEECISDLRREISSVKSAVMDSELSLTTGHTTLSAKVDRVNGHVAALKEWQITHDGIEQGRREMGAGIRNWIILGFGLTTAIQAAIGITIYLAAS